MIKRGFDIFLVVLLLPVIAFFLVLIGVIIYCSSGLPILHWSRRNGQNNNEFMMPKFRTMQTDTPEIATHLLKHPEKWLTPIGAFLRRTSIDEFPQLWSIVKGEMSFVGPRPALFNQHDLIALRTEFGVHTLKPGLTGWAQINGRDQNSIEDKVLFDKEYMEKKSLFFDLSIIIQTFRKISGDKDVSH